MGSDLLVGTCLISENLRPNCRTEPPRGGGLSVGVNYANLDKNRRKQQGKGEGKQSRKTELRKERPAYSLFTPGATGGLHGSLWRCFNAVTDSASPGKETHLWAVLTGSMAQWSRLNPVSSVGCVTFQKTLHPTCLIF